MKRQWNCYVRESPTKESDINTINSMKAKTKEMKEKLADIIFGSTNQLTLKLVEKPQEKQLVNL